MRKFSATEKQTISSFASGLSAAILLIALISLVLFIVLKGSAYFWPSQVFKVTTYDQSSNGVSVFAPSSVDIDEFNAALTNKLNAQFSSSKQPMPLMVVEQVDAIYQINLRSGAIQYGNFTQINTPDSKLYQLAGLNDVVASVAIFESELHEIQTNYLTVLHRKIALLNQSGVSSQAPARLKELEQFKSNLFGGKEKDFVVFFNSRNIRRKQIPDAILAYRHFLDTLPVEKQNKCLFLLHTQPVEEHGTDLNAVIDLLCPEDHQHVYFTNGMFDPIRMNWLYNLADTCILLTSNEGWGLSLTEALLTGTPIIANVTGGMQDQMRFEFKDGTWIDFDADFPSNHRGTYRKHGEWAFPVYPTSRSIVGSVPTPYIYDDRCEAEDATKQIEATYNLSSEERKAKGALGREWALGDEAGFTSEKMSNRVITYVDQLFDQWQPREKFEFILAGEVAKKKLVHKLIY